MKTFLLTVLFIALCINKLANADPLTDGDIPVDVCDSLRIEGKCRPAPLSAEDNMLKKKSSGKEMQIKRKLTLPAQSPKQRPAACEAHFSTSYAQMNDQVKVVTTVKNDTCGASHGVFSIRVRTLGHSGETLTRSFSEPWSRRNEEATRVTSYYPMESSTDLIWVRVNSNRKTACACG